MNDPENPRQEPPFARLAAPKPSPVWLWARVASALLVVSLAFGYMGAVIYRQHMALSEATAHQEAIEPSPTERPPMHAPVVAEMSRAPKNRPPLAMPPLLLTEKEAIAKFGSPNIVETNKSKSDFAWDKVYQYGNLMVSGYDTSSGFALYFRSGLCVSWQLLFPGSLRQLESYPTFSELVERGRIPLAAMAEGVEQKEDDQYTKIIKHVSNGAEAWSVEGAAVPVRVYDPDKGTFVFQNSHRGDYRIRQIVVKYLGTIGVAEMNAAVIRAVNSGVPEDAATKPFIGRRVSFDAQPGDQASAVCRYCYYLQAGNVALVAKPANASDSILDPRNLPTDALLIVKYLDSGGTVHVDGRVESASSSSGSDPLLVSITQISSR